MVSSVKVTGILNQREMAGAPVARHLIDKARERGSREVSFMVCLHKVLQAT